MAYQPIFDRTGRVVSLEGLTRWNHAETGVVKPNDLIQLADVRQQGPRWPGRRDVGFPCRPALYCSWVKRPPSTGIDTPVM